MTKVTKQDILESSGSLQVCADANPGVRQQCAQRTAYSSTRNRCSVASGYVKRLQLTKSSRRPSKHQGSLSSVSYICNQYLPSPSTTSCIRGGKEPISSDDTSQCDPLAMCMYAVSLQQLISRLQAVSQAKQCWFADDATGCGSLQDIRVWWGELIVAGPD